ncbi:MAG: cytochrome C oxidase subunit IV family protein [Bryobacteraceae bacterium]
MDTHTTHAEHVGGSVRTFTMVWIWLLALTGGEVFLAYVQLEAILMLTILVGASVIKAALIIAYFMHLKFEKFSLFLTLFPMLILCILLMFILMPDAMRSLNMRSL